ncbi:CD1375 family protein [Geomicrobium sp. JCM 19039]|nr:CD1375 family protein [Geomicrobium sp. JCM 19039]
MNSTQMVGVYVTLVQAGRRSLEEGDDVPVVPQILREQVEAEVNA